MTIDELAEAVGMSVRNVRAHQSRGLLPPVQRVGRRAGYGPEHVVRLRLIADLQAAGMNLVGVEALLGRGAEALERLSLLRRDVLRDLDVGPTLRIGDAQLAVLREVDPELPDRLVALGTLTRLPDGGYAALSRTLLAAGRLLQRQGVAPTTLVQVADEVLLAAEALAARLLELVDTATERHTAIALQVLVGELLAGHLSRALSR